MKAALGLRPNLAKGVNAPAAQTTLLVADGSCPKIRELLAEALVPWCASSGWTATKSAGVGDGWPSGAAAAGQTLHWASQPRIGALQTAD